MAPIMALAEQHQLIVIEDAAQALMSSYRGKPAGTLGHLGVFSFMTPRTLFREKAARCVINDARFTERSEIAYRYGTDRGAFDRGERKRYEWIALGSSFAPNEITAAVLLAQTRTCRRHHEGPPHHVGALSFRLRAA